MLKKDDMFLEKTNIRERLSKEKLKNKDAAHRILAEVHSILKDSDVQHERIQKSISSGKGADTNAFTFDLLETENIFHISDIKNICIDYRLRFLDSRYFKGEIPSEGLDKIKAIEKSHNIELKGFKIIAPSKLFKLEDKDDPLLFAPIGNGYFYLIHQWGNDLHALRKIMMWPFKNIVNLAFLVLVISLMVSLMVPDNLFSKVNSNVEFWIIFFFMFKSIAAVVIFYGVALGKNFNPAIWNSKYFNA